MSAPLEGGAWEPGDKFGEMLSPFIHRAVLPYLRDEGGKIPFALLSGLSLCGCYLVAINNGISFFSEDQGHYWLKVNLINQNQCHTWGDCVKTFGVALAEIW